MRIHLRRALFLAVLSGGFFPFQSYAAEVSTLFSLAQEQSGAQQKQAKGTLQSVCTPEALRQHLVAPMQFAPVPRYGDKYWQDSIPANMRESYIRAGEKFLGAKWETTDIALFSEYRKNGDRIRFQAFTYAKRNQLAALAMAEIMEGKGRFMKDILNGLFSLCEETWWGVPAHYGPNIPLVENQSMDLFNAETGGMIAWMYYMFAQPIRDFSPHLEKRILKEVSRRILEEGKRKKEWWRMAAMNWNPWICSNWLACVLFTEADREKQLEYMQLILQSLDGFIDRYPEDGGCDEGAHYWDRAAGSLFDCLNLLEPATGGLVNLSANAKVQLMGDYLCKMNIGNGYFVNFADAGPRLKPHIDWFPSGLYLNNRELISLSANTARERGFFQNPAVVYTDNYFYSFNRELMLLSHLSEFRKYEGRNVLLYDSWLPRIQVMTARSVPNSTEGLFIAAKGGHNAESHNHNDVGNFIVYADGLPLIVDPGVGTYRKETFNDATRYSIWSMQSGYHNLPKINGVDQRNGKKFAASGTYARFSGRKVQFGLDIAGAYPKEAQVDSWKRNIRFTRGKQIEVSEEYVLKEYLAPSEIMFMTQAEPQIEGNAVVFTLQGKRYGICFRPDEVEASFERLKLEDKKFVDMWGTLYRIKLTVKSDKLQGKVNYVIRSL